MSVCKHAAGSVGGGKFAPCQHCNRIAPAPQPPADATPHANDCVCLTCVPHCPPPTKAEFDALPSRWRRYVADLETNCDPGGMVRENAMLRDRIVQLEALINAPEIRDFVKAVQLEAAHQRSRWGSDHDAGKADADWFWLLGYLGGKALRTDDGPEKQLHRIITVAAAACNWHAAKLGLTNMRPGIETPKGLPPDDFDMSVFKNNGKEPVLR